LMARRPSRAARRASYHQARVTTADTGERALDAAVDALRAALARLDERNPLRADAARRSIAAQLAQFAAEADAERS
ncbi:hypothetical protein, partial [Nonomuraea dietziae]|uniref:hypothetical protein n=1 Tax=Nonomuraea dietziae TaxID=65515 RepID=UPI00344927ED